MKTQLQSDKEFEFMLVLARSLGTLKGIILTEQTLHRKIAILECYRDLVKDAPLSQKKDWVAWADEQISKCKQEFVNS